MSEEVKIFINKILKREIDAVCMYSLALLEPQSEIADKIYEVYERLISTDMHHNYHASSMTIGELERYDIQIKEIPEFSEFVISTLSRKLDEGLNKVLLDCREDFIIFNVCEYDICFVRFYGDLKLVFNTAKAISECLKVGEYAKADHELERLQERFASYYPKLKEMFEFKPAFFGFSVDLAAVEENISTYLSLRRKK